MIIDGFTFYNEFDILKKRLRYLSPVIDKFVLVESTVTHRGEPKELLFEKNREMFSEWLDKIIHIVVCDNPDGDDPWKRENHQRNCIVRGLEGIQDDALVMVSDVDEIPHRDFIQLPLDVDMCSFNMTAFQYSFKFIQQILHSQRTKDATLRFYRKAPSIYYLSIVVELLSLGMTFL